MAAVVVDDLITRYSLDASGYKSGAKDVQGVNLQLVSGSSDVAAGFGAVGVAAGVVAAAFTVSVAVSKQLVTGMVDLTRTMVSLGVEAAKRAADFDGYVQSLAAVVGGASQAAEKLKQLRELAGAPGIGFQESIQGYTKLRRSGMTDEFSAATLRELANQNALAGGGKAEFDRVITAISQMATKPFLQGEELLQLTEAGIPAHKMVKDIYGTSDTEELKRKGVSSGDVIKALVIEMSKMPRVAGSAKNAFENLETTLDMVKVSIGSGINQVLVPAAEGLTAAIERFDSGGAFKALGEKIGNDFEMIAEALTGTGSIDEAIMVILQSVSFLSDAVRNFWTNTIGAVQFAWNALKALPVIGPMFSGGEILFKKAIEDAKKQWEPFLAAGAAQSAKSGAWGGINGPVFEDEKPKIGPVPESVSLLREIANNTQRQVNLMRGALGGGDLGALGVSQVDLSGMRRSGGAGMDPARLIQIAFGIYGMQSARVVQSGRMR